MLHKMKSGRPPQLPKDTTANISEFISRLQFFCRLKLDKGKAHGKNKVEQELVGHDAIQEIWHRLSSTDKDALKLDALSPLHVFSFLLSPEDQKAAFQLTHEMLNQKDGKGGKSGKGKDHKSSSSRASSSKKSSSSALGLDDSSMAAAADMFL